jgi:hypothetical protein
MRIPFWQHIPEFANLLQKVEPTAIPDVYARQYLQHLLQHKHYYLNIYATCLQEAEISTDTILLDFGCGNAVLAMFAHFCGVEKVFAADSNSAFVLAAQTVAAQLEMNLSGWIIGNENALTKHFTQQMPDVLIAVDVIEHIYHIPRFLANLHAFNPKMLLLFTTASVYENPFIRYQLKQLQLADEYKGSNPIHSSGSYAGLPFFEIRKKLLQNAFPHIAPETLLQLAHQSRGLAEADILKLANGSLSFQPSADTNTCDPITGSYTERLLPIANWKQLFAAAGYRIQLKKGFYNTYRKGIKSLISSCLNKILSFTGFRFVPFYYIKASGAAPAQKTGSSTEV